MVFCPDRQRLFFLAWLVCALPLLFPAVNARGAGQEPDASSISEEYTKDLTGELPLEEVQELLDSMLGEESFRFSDALAELIGGGKPFSREQFARIACRAIFGEIGRQRGMLVKILLLVITAALLANLSRAFEKSGIVEVSFYVIYLLLFALLVNAFGSLSGRLEENLESITALMRAIAPAYYLAVSFASGVSTAALFYELLLLVILGIQMAAVHFILPCINLYVLLQLVNHLSKEDILSKLAELLKTVVEWALKTMLGVLVGLQVVQSLVAPVIDSLRRTTIGKTAGAIPGIGGAVNSVTEIVLTSAVLIRNSLGVVFLAAFALWGIAPLLWYGVNAFLYKLLAALVQPISDKRIVGCLSVLGEGCTLLLRTLFFVQVLCMLSVVIIAGSR